MSTTSEILKLKQEIKRKFNVITEIKVSSGKSKNNLQYKIYIDQDKFHSEYVDSTYISSFSVKHRESSILKVNDLAISAYARAAGGRKLKDRELFYALSDLTYMMMQFIQIYYNKEGNRFSKRKLMALKILS